MPRWRGGPLPALEGGDLGQGPFAAMHMLLQKTVLNINVADHRRALRQGDQGRVAQLAGGKSYSSDLGHQLALAAIEAKHAVVVMEFKRDIPLNRWIGVVKDSLEEARKAGLIARDVEKTVGDSLADGSARSRTAATRRTTGSFTPSCPIRSAASSCRRAGRCSSIASTRATRGGAW